MCICHLSKVYGLRVVLARWNVVSGSFEDNGWHMSSRFVRMRRGGQRQRVVTCEGSKSTAKKATRAMGQVKVSRLHMMAFLW